MSYLTSEIKMKKKVGIPKVDSRIQWTNSTDFLRPDTPRHPWPQVGLLRSRPDLIPRLFGSRFLPASVHDTRVTWGRDIDVRLRESSGPAEPPLGVRTAINDLRKRARKLPSYPEWP
jgi:hypothetical protein